MSKTNELPEHLEIGKFYNVKCAVMSNGEEEYHVPIIGDLHKDPQFGFNEAHYHIDCRFVGKNEIKRFYMTEEGYTNVVCGTERSFESSFIVKEVITKRMKCKRLTLGLKLPSYVFQTPFGRRYEAWAKNMIGKSCKGRKCPHLGTKMIEQNDMLFCPLHNLLGDREKEVIVSYLSDETKK